MSIGIVSLTTMFPLSVLRTIKASQLTKATELRFNADALLKLNPRLIYDPDRDGVTTVTMPDYYVIDPLGAASAGALAGTFGNVNGSLFPKNLTAGVNTGGVTRYDAGRNTFALADRFVTLPDSWVTQEEGAVGTLVTTSGATGATRMDGATFTLTSGVASRIVFFDADGLTIQVRSITATPAGSIIWTEDVDGSGALNGSEDLNGNGFLDHYPLPNTFAPITARIESQERRYSWLLTCRKISSETSAEIDVVVFFGRSVENISSDESLYPAAFKSNQKQITVDYSAFTANPPARRGGYVFDANNARWYRITSIIDDPANKSVSIGIEVPTFAGSPAAGGRVMFPRGVVDVFPIGTRSETP